MQSASYPIGGELERDRHLYIVYLSIYIIPSEKSGYSIDRVTLYVH